MRCPFAVWVGSPNFTRGGFAHPARGVVLHVEEGTEAGTEAWFQNPGAKASAHFGVGSDGRTAQFVDTDDKAWAQAAGNPYWWSIETEGRHTEPMTDAQVKAVARLVAWLRSLDAFPLELAESPTGRGLGWHGMGGSAWGGHYDCPGDARRAQRRAVLDLIAQTAKEAAMARFPNPVTAVTRPGHPGQVWVLGADGGVGAYPTEGPNACPFYGSYPGLPALERQGERAFLNIEADPDGGGYTLLADDGATYHFRP
jgi:hypothetical protein